jgi:hypothetical protein
MFCFTLVEVVDDANSSLFAVLGVLGVLCG